MKRALIRWIFGSGLALASVCACVSTPPVAPQLQAWPQRMQELQTAQHWDLQGRAAGAVGTQGWQASLDWRQSGQVADVRLAGPLGAGAMGFKLSPDGLAFTTPAAGATSPAEYLQQRLGFAPPLADLRYWLLGVPNPARAFDITSNSNGRPAELTQDGWSIEYGEYTAVGTDLLPKRLTLRRDAVRVRIAVDHWKLKP